MHINVKGAKQESENRKIYDKENRKEDFGRERYREKHCRQQENEGETGAVGGQIEMQKSNT